MVGLTYVDNLTLTWYQWVVVCVCPFVPEQYQVWCFPLCFVAFRGATTGKDNTIFWSEARQAKGKTWSNFLEHLHERRYIYLQNPHLTFLVSRLPVLWVWQAVMMGFFAMVGISLTPLSVIMMSQPSHDSIAYLLTLISWHVLTKNPLSAILTYGVACIAKPVSLVILPLMASKQPIMLTSLVMVIVYYAWARRYQFGRDVLKFLSVMGYHRHHSGESYTHHVSGRMRRFVRRWEKYRGYDVCSGLLFYTFPAWATWGAEEVLIVVVIALIAPNIKYFIFIT